MSFEQVKEIVNKFLQKMKITELENIGILKKVAKTLQIEVRTLIMYISALLFILVIFNYGAMIINQLVAFLYPSYMSFKAIESKSTKKHQQWLTYWIVISFISVLYPLLSLMPHWFLFQLLLTVYLFHPQTLGATTIY